jgi:phenylacetate-coenzyme A ligase PaaK-like adenylate-forming protein
MFKIKYPSRKELNKIVQKKLRYTIKYAYKYSPFYHELFKLNSILPDDIKNVDDLKRIPIVDSNTIKQNQPPTINEFKFLSASISDIQTIHETGGTTGIGKSLFYTKDDWKRMAIKSARAIKAMNPTKHDLILNCIGHGVGSSTFMAIEGAKLVGVPIITAAFSPFPPRYQLIEKYKPTILHHIFSMAKRLAMEMKETGMSPENSSIKKLWVAGEMMSKKMKIHLEKLWNAELFNLYGSTEAGAIAFECQEHIGLHVNEDSVLISARDPSHPEEIVENENGLCIITNLLEPNSNTGNVLINFNTEDIVKIIETKKCGCGNPFIQIDYPYRKIDLIQIENRRILKSFFDDIVIDLLEVNKNLTGEWEVILQKVSNFTKLNLRLETVYKEKITKKLKIPRKLQLLLKNLEKDNIKLTFELMLKGQLEIFKKPGKPKRVIFK